MTQAKSERADALRKPCKWRVVAVVKTKSGRMCPRGISGWFAVLSAAEQFAEMAKPEYPDAHVQAKRESRKVAAALDGNA